MLAIPRTESTLALLLLASAGLSGQAYEYTVFDFPAPPTGTYKHTEATAINNHGAVVGFFGFQKGPKSVWLGFKRAPGGALQILRYPEIEPEEGWSISPRAILNDGTIAGSYSVGTGLARRGLGFILANGQYTTIDLSPLPNGSTHIAAMNNKGDFTGSYTASNDPGNFVSINGVVTQLPARVANGGYYLHGIGADGTLVGCHEKGGYVRGPKGKHLIFQIPGAVGTCATGINTAAGKIVGWYATPGSTFLRSFVYDYAADLSLQLADSATAGVQPMVRQIPFTPVDVPGASETQVSGVNSHGAITGLALYTDPPSVRAFIGTPVP